ncbi:MAG: hypothetical protein JEZ14_08185 [Marinilabiliaceae bacterium]|nr:hypothetical protein [Marinilabiliaceae bacterium]
MAQAIQLRFYNADNKIAQQYEPYGWDLDLLLNNYQFTKIVDYDIDYSLFVTPNELLPILDLESQDEFLKSTSMGRSSIRAIKSILESNPDYQKIELFIFEWESGME